VKEAVSGSLKVQKETSQAYQPRPKGSDSGVVMKRVVEHEVANLLSVYIELLQSFNNAISYPVANIGPRELSQINRNVPKVALSGGKVSDSTKETTPAIFDSPPIKAYMYPARRATQLVDN
jgi:hypothetical protein